MHMVVWSKNRFDAPRVPDDGAICWSISHEYFSVAEWSACWTQAQKGLGSNRNRCRVTVLGKQFTPVVPSFIKQQNC